MVVLRVTSGSIGLQQPVSDDSLVPIDSCIVSYVVADIGISAIVFVGAGLNRRSASFAMLLRFLKALLSTSFCCRYSGLAISWIKRSHSKSVS